MGGKTLVKNTLVLGIIALFIISAVSPMVIGFKSDAVNCDAVIAEIVELESTELSGPMDSPWPMKCHDNRHTSRSPYSTANNSGFEKWRFKTKWDDGTIESSAVIGDDGTIYFGSMGSDHRLYALHPNGTEKWNYQVGLLIWSTPAIAEDGTIYVTSYDDYLHAVYPNGTRKWKFDAGDSISSSPAIAEDGTVYFGCNNKKIFAVNPNGTKKWHYTTGDMIVSDPVIGDDETIYIGSLDRYFYALWPNGTLRWRFKTGDWVKGHPSIADDGTVYIASFDHNLYALNPNGTLKWQRNSDYTGCSSVAIGKDSTLYFGSLIAAYPNNGTTKWSIDLPNIDHSSPAISADGTIYVSAGKSLVAVNPDGTEKWRREICNLRADSSPCIGEDGTIYVGSSWKEGVDWVGYLHAFGAGGELEADADGPYYGLINLPVQFSGTVEYGYPPYSWHWDFGDGNTSDEQNPTNTYTSPGNYTVALTVTDNSSNTSDDTTWAWIQATNDPPDEPSIDGETNGKVGVEYDYTFVTLDPDGNDIWYHICWGDKEIIYVYGPYHSGESIILSYTWPEKGTYNISCKARDVYNEESDWAYLEVTMPKNQQANSWWFLQFLQNHPWMFPILRQLLSFIK